MASLIDEKQGGQQFSFEANPFAARYLNHSFYSNDLQERVQLFNFAIYNESKLIEFLIFRRSYRSHIDLRVNKRFKEGVMRKEKPNPIRVFAIKLDDMFLPEEFPQIDFIKMDIEESEPLALIGATKIIERSPDIILILE